MRLSPQRKFGPPSPVAPLVRVQDLVTSHLALEPALTPSGKNKDSENFPVGSLLIRSDLRPHIHAFYDFARYADDISDNPLASAEVKITALDRLAAALKGEGHEDITCAINLRKSLEETDITPQHALDLLTAFKRDATQLRYADWADLLDYCRYSASPVGRYVLALHGIGETAWPASDAACSALQIINHIQDCADDYRELDRVYLPQDMLEKHSSDAAELSREKLTDGLRATLNEMLDLLQPMIAEAWNLPKQVPDLRLKLEVAIICAIAEKLTDLLRQRDPLCQNVKLGKLSLIGVILSGIGRAW